MVANTQPLAPCDEKRQYSVNEIYQFIGWGKYQRILFFFAGCGYCADSIETGLVSWLDDQAPGTRWPYEWGEANVAKHLSLLGTFVFVGELLSGFLWGPLADRVGRRPVFLISNLVLLIFGIASAFAPNFASFVIIRSIVGLAIGGVVIPFDNLAESVEDKDVVSITWSLNYFWSFGTIFVNILAPCILPQKFGSFDAWRVLTMAAAAPIVLAVVGYFFIEESPLWLQDQGRSEEAMAVLQRIARRNGKDISHMTLVPYMRDEHAHVSLTEIVKPGFRCRTLLLAVTWGCGILGYYGASLATPTIFKGDGTQYGPLLFGSSGEVFAIMMATILSSRIGLMRTVTIMFAMATLSTAGIVLKDMIPVVLLAIIDFFLRAGCMGGSCGAYVLTPLAYPTHIRATAFGFLYTMGRVGAVLAAFLNPGFNAKIVLYTCANLLCAICMGVGIKLFEVQTLRDDLSASVVSKRERSFVKSAEQAIERNM